MLPRPRALAVALLLLPFASAQTPAAAPSGSATKSSSHSHAGPFSTFTKSLPQEKKRPFMDLMKKLRSAKQASGTKDDKKKVTTGLDADIHKLLGPEYKRYRAVHSTVKEIKAASTKPPSAKPPPPPPLAATKKGGGKKKKPSTTA